MNQLRIHHYNCLFYLFVGAVGVAAFVALLAVFVAVLVSFCNIRKCERIKQMLTVEECQTSNIWLILFPLLLLLFSNKSINATVNIFIFSFFYLFISIDFDSPGVLVKNKHISQLHSISLLHFLFFIFILFIYLFFFFLMFTKLTEHIQ